MSERSTAAKSIDSGCPCGGEHYGRAHRQKAERVLAGTQTGTYSKRMMARDILALHALLDAHRGEFVRTAQETARDFDGPGDYLSWAQECLRDFEGEILWEHNGREEVA